MTTLSDITLYGLFPKDRSYLVDWQKILIEHKVYDCQTLYDYLSSGNPVFQRKEFLKILKLAAQTVEKRDTIEFPEISIPADETKRKAIERTDKLVYGDELPMFNPMTETSLKKKISLCNIATIKYLLGKITLYGKNGMNSITGFEGNFTDRRIVTAIEFYNEQLLRTASNIPNLQNYTGNLFTENRAEKEEIVLAHIEEIVDYLTEVGDKFVWGPLSQNFREMLKKSVKDSNFRDTYKDRLVALIRDYTTLEELMGDPISDGTLKRFIVTPLDKH